MAGQDVFPSPETSAEPSNDYERLRRFIRYHLGGFTLGLLRINDPHQRDDLLASLADTLLTDGAQLIRVDMKPRCPSTARSAPAIGGLRRAAPSWRSKPMRAPYPIRANFCLSSVQQASRL